jgi:mono/diheme cytochrome c family protein
LTTPGPERSEDEKKKPSNELSWTFLIVGVVLLIALWSYSRLGPSLARKQAPAIPKTASGIPQLTPAMVPLVTGEEPIELLLTKAGCPVCHTIPGVRGADGRVGPKLDLGRTGRTRLTDPRYRGQAATVHEYVIESILSPGVYVVPGYPDRAMPRWYGQKLSAAALEKVASYLESLRDEPATTP